MIFKSVLGSPKLYIGLAVVVATGAALWRLDYLRGANVDLRRELAVAQASQARSQELLTEERQARAEAEDRRGAYLIELQRASNETERLRDCIADGTCGLRVNTTCPAVPAAPSDAAGAAGTSPELDARARRAYFALREGLTRLEADFAFCQRELSSRSYRIDSEN